MLIAIDHGNKQIKASNKTFTSALTESDTKPAFGEDILQYEGKYYSLSENRIPYMRNKTADERFFILTLFAIGQEILATANYTAGEVVDISLVIGLPPSHIGGQAEQFENYFKNRDIICFHFKDKLFNVYIKEVICFPQAYAASITIYHKLKDIPKATIIDIGGFTVDYLLLRNGKGDLSVCDSLENGVITLYNAIKSKVNADFDILLEEIDIDAIIQGQLHNFSNEIINIVEQQAQKFINDLVNKLRERMIDLKSGTAVFVGGGSILLKRQIESCDKVTNSIFIEQIAANAQGYEILYHAYKQSR